MVLFGEYNDGQVEVEISKKILIKDVCDSIQEIIDFMYPSFLLELQSGTYFH